MIEELVKMLIQFFRGSCFDYACDMMSAIFQLGVHWIVGPRVT